MSLKLFDTEKRVKLEGAMAILKILSTNAWVAHVATKLWHNHQKMAILQVGHS